MDEDKAAQDFRLHIWVPKEPLRSRGQPTLNAPHQCPCACTDASLCLIAHAPFINWFPASVSQCQHLRGLLVAQSDMAPLPLSRRCFHTLRLAERLHLVDKAIISNADFHRSPAAYAARNGVVASPDFGTIDVKQSQA
jgi:hypothetical protein